MLPSKTNLSNKLWQESQSSRDLYEDPRNLKAVRILYFGEDKEHDDWSSILRLNKVADQMHECNCYALRSFTKFVEHLQEIKAFTNFHISSRHPTTLCTLTKGAEWYLNTNAQL